MKKVMACMALAIGVSSCQDELKVEPQVIDRPTNYTLTPDLGLQDQRGRLVYVRRVVSLTADQISSRLSALGVQAANGVHIYNIGYQSEDINGNPILLSGVIFYPDNKAPVMPMIMLNHGTITEKSGAPSVSPGEGLLEASQGFLVGAMDYVGFGDASQLTHPYLIEDSYVLSGIDMIRTVQEFASLNETTLAGLFLKGYSEGGYATLAIQKAIETQEDLRAEFLEGPFKLIASAPGAGPYLLSAIAKQLVAGEQVNPIYLTKVTEAYKNWFPEEVPAPYGDFFNYEALGVTNEAEAEQKLDQLLSGAFDYFSLLSMLPTDRATLVNDDFSMGFAAATLNPLGQVVNPEVDETGLLTKLEENNLVKGWSPQVMTRFYHCASDEVVPADVSRC